MTDRDRYADRTKIGSAVGAVYTRPWVVEMILDLTGVDPDLDLIDAGPIVEPACGDGAFLTAIVRRVIKSYNKYGHPTSALDTAVSGYEIDADAVAASRAHVEAELRACSVNAPLAERVARAWIRKADFLLETPDTPAAWVVGNPPYVRVEDADVQTMGLYRDRWPTMTGRADLYIGFLEAGLSLLSEGGRLGYICPDRWMFNRYGRAIRQRVTADFEVDKVVFMHGVDAFASRVNAYPSVVVLARGEPKVTFVAEVAETFNEHGVPALVAASRPGAKPLAVSTPSAFVSRRVNDWPRDNDGWTSPLIDDADFIEQVERSFPTLAEAGVTVGVGPATGADDVFIIKDASLVERGRLLPAIAASDTVSGRVIWPGRYLINPWGENGLLVDLNDYPKLALYFEEHQRRLKFRRVAKDHPSAWWRTIDRIKPELATTSKLLLPDMRPILHPVLDSGQFLPMHNLNFVVAPDWDLEVLGGILLSDVVAAFLRVYSVKMSRGYLRVSTQYLRKVRIPHFADISDFHAQSLRQAFLNNDRETATTVSRSLYGLAGAVRTDIG